MTQFKARPTTYKGIRMRSRMEAGFAAWLDRGHVLWRYEPQAFASESGQYLPDFELPEIPFLGEPERVFIEVKPVQPDLNVLVVQQSIIKESDPEAQLVAVWPDGGGYRTMLIFDGSWAELVWTYRPHTFALDAEITFSPWRDEYWKPRPS